MGEEEGQQEVKTTADRRFLVEGEGTADPFDGGILNREVTMTGHREKDGVDWLAVILCVHGDHWACSWSVVAPGTWITLSHCATLFVTFNGGCHAQ